MRPVVPHYVRRNESSRMPRRFLYFDTEVWRRRHGATEAQTFRLAVGCAEGWSARNGEPLPPQWERFDSPAALWKWADEHASPSYRTIMVAHNLAYDLRVADVFGELPALGWRCERIRLDHGSAHARWTNGRKTLLMVDTLAWLPESLLSIGTKVGLGKPELPNDDDDDDAWHDRCRADVEILRAAWRRVVDWIGANDLGNWQVTGSSMAWAAWRHRFLDDRVLVGMDEQTRSLERESAHAGRAEAWRHGTFNNRRVHEWDYRLAYAHIGRTAELPVRPMGPPRPVPLAKVLATSRSIAWLCGITVTTDLPTLPATSGGRVLWPVGTFDTTVWEPELRMAIEEGAQVKVRWARPYLRKPILSKFMEWAIEQVETGGGTDDAIVATMVKHWTRALVGRFAMQFKSWESAGTTDRPDVLLLPGVDIDTGEPYRYLFLGADVFKESELTEFPDGSPAVLAYVMGLARVQLWRAMRAAGLDNVVYVDTDAVMVTPRGSRNIAAAVDAGQLAGLRLKAKYERLEVIGPRQLIVDGHLRVAGVRGTATRTGPRTFSTEAWRGIGESLKRREAATVKVIDRTVRLRGATGRRQLLAGGRTLPWSLPDLPPPPARSAAGSPAPDLEG